MRGASRSNNDCLARSVIGRVVSDCGGRSFRPPNSPPMMRMAFNVADIAPRPLESRPSQFSDGSPRMSSSLCDKCAALCCRYFALPIDNPKSAHDYDNVRWYLMHENVVVFVEKR